MNVKRLSKPNRLNLKCFDKLMMAHFDLITLQRKLKTIGILNSLRTYSYMCICGWFTYDISV